ncbi:enoyl-CoA hydratase domain-containing protein 3, mitochondrial [Eurytemora carolleeae]|uniref:enoyl-CoA hydratase domain-containing protein 3, mitochondrial n=1 Tax=Eurytemora carolleeae TaxID=1294199 RepID=UPI000C7901F5|nr:enoyl-CoA hydratase domain-containing protein 3, mitochondrial [Eurytemora carolleeae]|eukprot:XP_023331820.1 enoyl-CoA hydratase domain-containing protein 3, mitochondrial-like [Eurytemora affinis]
MTQETGKEYHQTIFTTCETLMKLLGQLPVPVISVVTGVAAAAGCQLVASSDIVVATPQSSYSTPGASVGLFCHTPGIPLARRVSRAMSGYMLLTGLSISGEEAYNAGLVSRLVPEQDIQTEVDRICSAIAGKPRGVIALGKRFYRKQIEMPLNSAYPAGGEVMLHNLWFKDAQEGITAFKEKRKPSFTHSDETVQ